MEHTVEGQSPKLEKPSSSAADQSCIHMYPDWAAMQYANSWQCYGPTMVLLWSYYGPQFAMQPYLNSATPSRHGPPPYLWIPPQSMIPHYGPTYAAFYANGGFFSHPGVPVAGTHSLDAPIKSGNTDGGFMKKLKEFDGLAKSIGNGNQADTERKTDHRQSESEESEGSSDGSNGNIARVGESSRKRSPQGSPSNEEAKKKCHAVVTAEINRDAAKTSRQANTPVETLDKKKTVMDSDDASDYKVKQSPDAVPLSSVPTEPWIHNERDLKRERRKQSNRESARRSRLRKQAEMEELAAKVQALTSENLTLKSEINKLMVASSKMRHENAALMGKQKVAVKEEAIDGPSLKPDGTQNLLERVNKNGSPARRIDNDDSFQSQRPAVKLHQLLDGSNRTGPVAAG